MRKGDFTTLGATAHSDEEREENDFYATDPKALELFLDQTGIELRNVWECACGEGHLAEVLKQRGLLGRASDLIDRGYGFGGVDFLTENFDNYEMKFNTVITNPPFSLFQEFVEKALTIANKKVIMFGKLQALEGQKRATFLQKTPLKTVYVFKKRQQPMRNGKENDEITGKKMSTTMAFAWFVWEIGYEGEPIIKWI